MLEETAAVGVAEAALEAARIGPRHHPSPCQPRIGTSPVSVEWTGVLERGKGWLE